MLIPTIFLMFLIITQKDSFSRFFSEESLKKLSISNKYFSKKARNTTLFLALIFMIIALARPVTNEKIHTSKQELNTLIIAIDVSKSMLATDIYPNRLEFAKKKLLDIINQSKTSAIGVVLFAKSSFILSPLTQDFTSLRILVENLDTGANFDNGTNIYSTLEITNKLLKDYSNKNLLILSDGGDKKEFDEEIEYANKNNISVYTIALASKNGAAIKQKDGNYLTNQNGEIVTVKLNENIKKLSLNTNGGFINYSLDNNDLNEIINDIENKSKKEQFQSRKHKTYTELFYYPLALGIFFLFIAFSSTPKFRKSTSTALLIVTSTILFTTPNKLNAGVFDFLTIKEANEAYKKDDFETAIKNYEKLDSENERDYNLANSLYKKGNYKEAIKNYENINSEDRDLNFSKLHNLGNSYAKSGDLQKAVKNYEKALRIKNDKETKENLETIKKAMQKQQNKDSKNSKDNKKNKKKQKQENKENQKNKKDNSEKNKQNSKKEKNKKDEQSKSQEQKKNELNKKQKDENKNKDNKTAKTGKKIDLKNISDKEEQRWLKQLKHQKTNSLLKKVESSKESDPTSNPW